MKRDASADTGQNMRTDQTYTLEFGVVHHRTVSHGKCIDHLQFRQIFLMVRADMIKYEQIQRRMIVSALIEILMAVCRMCHRNRGVCNLGDKVKKLRIILKFQQFKPRICLFGINLHEAVVIFSLHGNVHIIIPRDKVLMSDCAQKRTAVKEIIYVMRFADSVHFA